MKNGWKMDDNCWKLIEIDEKLMKHGWKIDENRWLDEKWMRNGWKIDEKWMKIAENW